MIFDWTNPEEKILAEIADLAMSEEDITFDYEALIVLTGGKPDPRVDIAKINKAIRKRWSRNAQNRIKKNAWAQVEAARKMEGK